MWFKWFSHQFPMKFRKKIDSATFPINWKLRSKLLLLSWQRKFKGFLSVQFRLQTAFWAEIMCWFVSRIQKAFLRTEENLGWQLFSPPCRISCRSTRLAWIVPITLCLDTCTAHMWNIFVILHLNASYDEWQVSPCRMHFVALSLLDMHNWAQLHHICF